MGKQNVPTVAFNGGEIGREVMSRTSLDTYPNTASLMENWLPEVAGPMRFRGGLKFCNHIPGDEPLWLRRFTFDVEQAYVLGLTPTEMRIIKGAGIIIREAVTAAIVNPDFTADLSGWTLDVPASSDSGSAGLGTGTTGDTGAAFPGERFND